MKARTSHVGIWACCLVTSLAWVFAAGAASDTKETEPTEAPAPLKVADATPAADAMASKGPIVGEPILMSAPVTETVEQMMARDALLPQRDMTKPRMTHPEFEVELPRAFNPDAPAVSQWPPAPDRLSVPSPFLPQTLGTQFNGVTSAESGFIPPDTMGAVSPTQILFHENGRVKVFNKTGTLGALNVTDLAFWTSVTNGVQPSDPEVRYDRLTGRWFVLAVNTPATNNRVMIAFTAPNTTITAATSFTFVQFTAPSGVDAGCFLDFPSFGIDANAVYVGGNMFCPTSYSWSDAFVIPKATLLGTANGGTPTAFAFRNVTNGLTGPGPFAPQGVDNDDPNATEGYLIGTNVVENSTVQILRITTPGGTPTYSGTPLALTLPLNTTPFNQPASGSTTAVNVPGDTRVTKAQIHKNKITGALSLWTAHTVGVNSSGVSVSADRNGARWYEITGTLSTPAAPLGGSPMLVQAGTLFDSAGANPRGYIYPTIAGSGQGHAAFGTTFASAALQTSIGVSGRLRTDALGTQQAATTAIAGASNYTSNDTGGRNRWGDYTNTVVDPTDDQTFWTFQEYASGANVWAVRAVQLKAAAPATPASASSNVCQGRASTSVVITGTSSAGTEFFDPGPDTGGPGYANHIAATLSGGTAPTVNSITFTDPTHVTLNLNTTSATTGLKNVAITNPDGQTAVGTGVVNVVATCNASISGTVTDASNSLGINGATVTAQNLTTTTNSAGAYSFTSLAAGTYTVTVTAPGYASGTASVPVIDGQSATQDFSLTRGVSDVAACKTDTIEADFESGSLSGLDANSSPGNVVMPFTAQVDQSSTTLALVANTVSTTQWEAQSFIAGVTGNLTAVAFAAGTTSATGAPTVTVEVHADNAGNPGALIAGATATSGTFSPINTIFNVTLTLGTPAPVVSGTRYHLVFKGSTSQLRAFVSPTCATPCTTYANGTAIITTNSGGAWTAQTWDELFQTFVAPTIASGTMISSLRDANPSSGNTSRWSLSFTNAALPGGTTLQLQAAASNSPTGPFTFVGPGGSTGTFWTTSPVSAADMAQFNGFRYLKYKVSMSRNGFVTPTLNDVTVCFTNGCQGAANGTSCNDGNACTQTDTCQSNVCFGGNPVSCAAGDQCNNAATCNVGTGVCSTSSQKANGTSCSDGNGCTSGDTCQSGTCTAGTPVVCTPLDQCHDAGTCNPGTGLCSNPNKANGSACSDANACTQTDTCQSGTCTGANPVTCTALDPCHDAGTCNPGTGLCSNPNKANGTACNDANACTQTDTCQSGTCTGGNPVVCTASDQCHDAGTCDSGTGLCSNPAKADGSSCSDGNACTTGDTCQSGTCTAGTPVTCTALDSCHDAGTCDSGTGLCSNPAKADGTSCSDADACTQTDTCQSGVCTGSSPVVCAPPDQCHDAGTCNPGTGVCSNPAKADGTACNDSNACTQTDTCQAGTCTGGSPVVCTASDQCHIAGSCDTGTGLCSNPVKPDGSACSDGNGCTQTDTCQSGTCIGSNPLNCNDSNPCTDDACNPGTGTCVFVANDGNSCTDGNACTNDACSGGSCVHTASGACGATGSVFYYRSNVSPGTEPTTKPVPQVGIDSNNDATAEATTDGSGAYAISNLAGHVTLAPLAKYGSPRVSDDNGAISSLDASLIARTVVGITTMSPNQRLAGDVTGNGSLSSLDASEVSRFTVGLVDHFDVAVATGTDWKFLRCDAYAYPGNPGCGAAIYDYNPIGASVTGQNFYAVLYGEVTGNWQPAAPFAASARQASPEELAAFDADQLAAARLRQNTPAPVVRDAASGPAELTVNGWTAPLQAGHRRQVTIDVRNADGILALDLALKYDPSQIAIVAVGPTGIASGFAVADGDSQGTHRIATYGVLPLSGSGSLLTVTIEAVKTTGRPVPLTLSGSANEGAIPVTVRGDKGGPRAVLAPAVR